MGSSELTILETALEKAKNLPLVEGMSKDANYYRKKAKADNTYRSYRSALKDFVKWSGIDMPLPTTSTVVLAYLEAKAQSTPQPAPSTLYHRIAALRYAQLILGYADPADSKPVREFLSGYNKDRVECDGWKAKKAPALELGELIQLVASFENDLRGIRDKAMVLVAVVGSFRENELTSLKVEQISHQTDKDIVFDMGGIKHDSTNKKGNTKVLCAWPGPLNPITALNEWIRESGIESGYIFRSITRWGEVVDNVDKEGSIKPMSHNTANKIIKQAAERAGLKDYNQYTVHSLRATFVTLARDMGIPDNKIIRQTNHKSELTLPVYDRPKDAVKHSPAVELGEVIRELINTDT